MKIVDPKNKFINLTNQNFKHMNLFLKSHKFTCPRIETHVIHNYFIHIWWCKNKKKKIKQLKLSAASEDVKMIFLIALPSRDVVYFYNLK